MILRNIKYQIESKFWKKRIMDISDGILTTFILGKLNHKDFKNSGIAIISFLL